MLAVTPPRYPCERPRAIDGDTLACDVPIGLRGITLVNEMVRLVGIDTPELHARDVADRERAQAARLALAQLVAQGDVWLVVDPRDATDKYGRLLATVWVGDTNVNALMVQRGLAKPYDGGKR